MSQDELPEPPAEISDLALACIAYVERATGIRLDYTMETLPILDHYIREVRADAVTKPEVVEVTAAAAGAYIGEVIRRKLPLGWFAPPGEYRRWRIELESVFLSVNPIGIAVEAIYLQPAEGWGAHFRMRPEDERRAEAALEILPQISEDEFYAPSSRVEVLEIIVDAILGSIDEPRRYTADDYGPFRAEAIGEALDKGGGTH